MKTALSLIAALAVAPALAETSQPYAGEQSRAIASLSESDVDALLAGQGWGLALPAELNGYPGPLHVLELADELALSAAQRAEVQAVYDRMKAEAQVLGQQYVEAEAHLSRMFRMGHANEDMLTTMLTRSSETLAALRAVHLSAHLEVTPMLTDEQKQTYENLRGYGAGEHGAGHADHSGHGSH